MDSTQAFKPAHFDPQKEMQNAQRLSISQAARILNISTSTLRRLEQEGKISSVRDKNHYRHYGLGDVRALKDALVHEHSEKSVKQKPLNETVAVNRSIPKGDANQRTKRRLLRKVTKTVSIVTVCLVLASLLSFTYRSKTSQHVGDSLALRPEIGNVLALRSNAPSLEYVVNIPSRFAQGVNFLNSVQVQDDLDVDGVARLSTIEELEAIDETTETTIENALDIQGDVTGEGLQNVQIAANVISDNELADTITYTGILNVTGSLLLDGDALTSSTDQLNLLDELNARAGGVVYSEADSLNVSQAGTVGQILISQGSGAPTWINQSDLDISGLGDLTPEQLLRSDASDFYTTGVLTFNTGTSLTLASGAEFNCIDCVTLGSETLGNYVASVVSGSGIQTNAGPPGEGTLHTLSLGALTADWQQTGPFDVILSNASSELQILESSGGTFYGNIDVGDLSADRVYTLPNASGEFSLLGQSISNAELVNDSLTVSPGTGLSGGGLVTLGGSVSLSSTLGTSIEGGEITDGTIEAVDLETTNAPTEDFFLSYDSATGGFTWLEVTGGGAGDITEVIAGAGLTGGSTIGSATVDVGAGTGIIVGANDISVNQATNFVWTGEHSWANTLTNSASQAGFSLTLGDDGGVDTVSAINVDATSAATGDADNLYGISINDLSLASGTVNEIAMRVGTGWDDILNYNGTTVIDGDGTIPTSRLFGTLITLAGDSGSGTVIQGETVTLSGGTNLTSSHAGDTVTVNLDSTITLAGDLTVQGQNVNFDNATDIDIDDALPGALTISEGANNYLAINTSNASEMISLGNTTTNPGFSLLGTGVATFGGTLSVSGDTIGLNNDADADNVFGLLAAGGSAGSNLYWGDDLLCDVSQTNCGWATSAGVYTSWSVADSSGDTQNVLNSNVLRFTSSDSNVLTNLTGVDDGDDVLDLSIRRDGDIIASGGLTGDVNNILVGSDANDVTLAVGAGNGILVNTDNVAVNEDFNFTFTGNNTFTPGGGDDLDINLDSDSVLTIDSVLADPINANSVTHTLTNTSVSGIQNAMYIDNAPSSGVTESLLVLDNSDDNTQVTNAIEFVNGGTGFTNLFNVSGVLISSTEFEILDNAISLIDEVSGILPVANGGTGLDATLVDDGELLIGNDTINGFARSTLSAGSGVTINNAPGAITIGHTDTSSQSSLDNSAAVVIQDVTLDTFGHISALGTVDLSTLFDNYSSWVVADDDTGTYSVASGSILRFTSSDGNVLTDVTNGDDADENLNLTIRRDGDLVAGGGLTGDVNNIFVGSDADDVTLAVGAGTGITVNANDIAINQATSFGWTGIHSWTNTLTNGIQGDFNLTLGNDTDADVLSAINVDITSTATGDADTVFAIQLGDVTTPQAEVTETAMRIGDGYDNLFEFEGTADGFETVIRMENPLADRIYTIPYETLDAEFCMSTGNCSGIGVQTFTTIDTPSGADPVADSSSDSLQFLVSGSNLTITGADNPETVTFNIDETALAGAGLAANADALDIGAGNGITVNANDVAVNQAYGFTFTGNNTFTPGSTDDLTINLDSDSLFSVNQTFSGTTTANSLTYVLTNMSSSGTQNGLYLDNAASTGTTESLLVLDNSDADTAVTNAIEIIEAGGGGFTNILNLNGTGLSSTELGILDSGITLGSETAGDYVAGFTAGGGLTGDASGEGSNPTLAVGAGTGITVNANDVAVNQATNFGWTGIHSWTNAITNTGSQADFNLTLGDDGDVDTVSAINIDATSAATSDADNLFGITINDLISPSATVNEYGIYQTGTNWDLGALFADTVQLGENGQDGQLVLFNERAAGDTTITFNLSDSQSANITYTLPPTAGSSNFVLMTNGSGVLSWEDVTAGPGGGDIDSVTAGAGMTGGGTSGDVTLDVVGGLGITANANDIAIDLLDSVDGDGGTSSHSGLELQGASSDELALLQGCDDGEVLAWDNSSNVWACTPVDGIGGVGDITSVTAGTGLTGGGTSGDVTLDIGAGNGITVNANDVAVNQAYGFTFTGNNTFTPGSTDDVTINLDSDSLFSVNQAFTGTTTANSLTYVLTNTSSSGTQNGLYLDNAASTGTTESLLVLDNSDADTAVTNAIEIIEAGGVGFTNILNLNGVGLSSTELGILDSGITLGSETAGDYVAGFTAGGGLTGDASGEGSNPTLAVGAGTGITVNANDVAVNQATNFAWTGIHSWTNAITNTGSQADFNLTLGDDGDIDTVSAINIDATSAATSDADNLFGLTISNLTGADGTVTEYAFRVGTGWDDIFNYNGTTVIDGDGTIPVGQLNGTLFSVSDTSTTELVSQGETVYFADSTTINATVSATNQVTHNVVANTLDYIHLQDTLDLDAITETNLAGNNLIFDLDGAGDLLIHDGGAALASFNDTSVIAFTPANTTTASGRVLIDGSTTNSTATAGLLDIDATTVTDGFEAINLDLNISDDAGADTVIGAFITIDNNATTVDDTVYGLSIVNEDQGAGTDADMMADALIRLRNDDDGVSLTDALLITAASGGGITDAVDASDSTLLNALNAGQNFILGDGIRQFSSSSAVWTFEDTSNNDLMTLTDNSNVGDLVLTGTGSFYGTTLGLNNDASVTNVLSFNAAAGGGATGDLYWGNDLLCDVDATNCGWSTGASGTPNFDEVYAESINDGELTMEIDNASGLNFNLTTTGDFTIQAAGNSFARFLDNGTTQLGQTDYVSFATTGDMTFVGSDAASIIGPNGGNLNIVAGTAQNIVLSTDLTNRVGVGTGTTPSGKFEIEVANNTELTGFVLDANDADQIAMQIESSQNTADIIDIIGNSLTTGRGIDISLDALTNGTGVNIKSASTTLGVATEGGSLLNLEWTANATSSADLFSIDIGQNSTLLGNLFVASDNGSDVFAIATAGVTSSVPFQINTGGDLSVGYDITMTNQTASKIESYGPLTIETGELFENNDLVLKTYGTGEVAVQGGGLSLETGEFLALDSNESGDSYIRHNNTGNDYISVYTNATEVVRFMNDGSVDGNTTFDANQFDVAEAYPTFDTSLQAAQVVMIDPVQTPGQSSLVTKATNSYRDQVVGIVSTSPGFTLGAGSFATEFCQDVNEKGVDTIVNEYLEGLAVQEGLDEQLVEDSEIVNGQTIVEAETAIKVEAKRKAAEACLTPSKVLVALAGRVPVEVAWEGEDIRVGDPLTISHEPGKATKATTAGMIVGRALEGYTQADNDTGKTTVMAMLQVNWWGGGEYANNQSASWRSNNANIEDDLGGDALGDVTLRNDLTVLGKTNLGDTSVIGTLSLGSTSIRDGAINAVAKTLYLQNEFAVGNVDIFNGKIVMTTAGDVTVRGRIEADTVVAGEFKINQEKQTTGRAIINAGQRTLTVYNSAVKANSKVFVTLRTVTDKSLIVTNIYDSQAFTVELPSVTNKNIEFDYWIVGVE